jgi:hypothetical protein
MKKLFIFLLISLYFTSSVYADSRNFSFKADNTKINVRTPDGFYESSNIYPERLEFVRTFYPDYLMVHAVLVPKGIPDTERLSRYMILVTNKKADKHKITQSFFDETRDLMREQQFTLINEYRDMIDDALEEGTSKVFNKYDVDFITEIGETVPLGVFIDNEKVISLNMISNTNISNNGINHSFLQLMSFSMVFVKNKIVNVYIYSDFDSEKDIIWIEAKTNELVNLLINNN